MILINIITLVFVLGEYKPSVSHPPTRTPTCARIHTMGYSQVRPCEILLLH